MPDRRLVRLVSLGTHVMHCAWVSRKFERQTHDAEAGLEKPRFFGIFLRFLVFYVFLGYLGFNVHNAEHRYMTHDK